MEAKRKKSNGSEKMMTRKETTEKLINDYHKRRSILGQGVTETVN